MLRKKLENIGGHNLKLTLYIQELIMKKGLRQFFENSCWRELWILAFLKSLGSPALYTTENVKLKLDICTLGYIEL